MNDKEEYKLVFEHFKSMEQRYHTWMNYYSLFNGALLVAYCSILVSMGKISPKDGSYELNCTYWDFLVLIALLGLWASLCWRLSIKGHNSWLNSWRLALRSYGYEFDSHIYLREKDYEKNKEGNILHIKPPFNSTVKVTTSFIWGVIIAWFFALVYAVGKYLGDIDTENWQWVGELSVTSLTLDCIKVLILEFFFIYIICTYLFKNFYSDLSNMYVKIFDEQGLELRILKYKTRFWRIIDFLLTIIKWLYLCLKQIGPCLKQFCSCLKQIGPFIKQLWLHIRRSGFRIRSSKWEVKPQQEKEDSSNPLISQSIELSKVIEEVIKEIIKRLENKNVEAKEEQKTDTGR